MRRDNPTSSEAGVKRHRSIVARLLLLCMTGVCMISVRGIPARGCFGSTPNRIGVIPGVTPGVAIIASDIIIAVGVLTCRAAPGV